MRPTQPYRWLYENQKRLLQFDCKNLDEWRAWRNALRAQLIDLLGALERPRFPPKLTYESEVDKGNYLRCKVTYNTDELATNPAYLLKPKDPNGAAVLVLHGHGSGKFDIVGPDEPGRLPPEIYARYQNSFAVKMAEEGFTVLIPDQAGFGERREQDDVEKGPMSSSCWQLSTWAMLYGETAVGVRVRDAQQSLDVLSSLNWVKKIGVMGASSGGALALYLSALDDRIMATAVSAYLNTYNDSILTVRTHCIDNYIPGVLKYAEMYDIAALIAPRPFFGENGIYDPGIPITGFRVAVEKVRQAYALLGASDKFEAYEFEGGHAMTHKPVEFMEKWLVKEAEI